MNIYTRNGDRGFTDTLAAGRVPKSSPLIEALGTMDEFMACCGLVRARIHEKASGQVSDLEEFILATMDFIQESILAINGRLVTNDPNNDGVTEKDVKRIEDGIDTMWKGMKTIGFIKFGANMLSAELQHARAVCRRAERELWKIPSHYMDHHTLTAQFMNRLSDLLFVLGYITAERV